MFQIDAALKEFLESRVAVQVASANRAGRPHSSSAWGPRVNTDGSVTLFFDSPRAGSHFANFAQNPRLAAVFGDPISYRSVQLKGRWISTSEPSEEERKWVNRHRQLFASAAVLVGDPPDSVRNMWMDEVTRIDFLVEAAFDQTPGPNAGMPL
jgi:hypothetical protein